MNKFRTTLFTTGTPSIWKKQSAKRLPQRRRVKYPHFLNANPPRAKAKLLPISFNLPAANVSLQRKVPSKRR